MRTRRWRSSDTSTWHAGLARYGPGSRPAGMQLLLPQWIVEDAGRWRPRAVVHPATERPARDRRGEPVALPPDNEDLEIGWQLHPDVWGHGNASETTYALAQWAFSQHRGDLRSRQTGQHTCRSHSPPQRPGMSR